MNMREVNRKRDNVRQSLSAIVANDNFLRDLEQIQQDEEDVIGKFAKIGEEDEYQRVEVSIQEPQQQLDDAYDLLDALERAFPGNQYMDLDEFLETPTDMSS